MTGTVVRYQTRTLVPPAPEMPKRRRPRAKRVIGAITFVAALGGAIHLMVGEFQLSFDGRFTLAVFALAVWAWVFTKLDDTYVALAAGTVLALAGVLAQDSLFSTLGDDTIWLLVAAFVIASGVTQSGLATRAAMWLVSSARTVRGLVHIVTAALVVTAFAIPSTSGRAALTLPVFVALAKVLSQPVHEGRHRRVVHVLALVFPTVILLSAVGSLLGAGAHLVTSRVLVAATGEGFDFAQWLILGLPLAVVSSHLASELILRLFSAGSDRKQRIQFTVSDLQAVTPTRVTGALSVQESRAAIILGSVVVLWCTQPVHHIPPAIVALLGALVTTSPKFGSVRLKKTLTQVPWSLLLFMAATLALGEALISSGAASWLANGLFAQIGDASPKVFMLAVIVLSTLSHLVIQSRSARSAVLVPIVVALAASAGISPAAAAFASTAAAGFCHTLPSSAKPVAMFSAVEDVQTYSPGDLLKLSAFLGPLMVGCVYLFSAYVWPVLGLAW